MRSLSCSIAGSASIVVSAGSRRIETGQCGGAAPGFGRPPAILRPRLRRFAALQRLENLAGAGLVKVFVKIVTMLQHRRVHAGAETFHLDHRELAVSSGLARADAEMFPAGSQHLVRTGKPARRRRADLHEM